MEQTTNATTTQQKKWFDVYRQTLPAVARHPATWLLTLIFVLSTVYLLVIKVITPPVLLFVAFSVILTLLVFPLTQEAPAAAWEIPLQLAQRPRLWLQAALTFLLTLALSLVSLLPALRTVVPILAPVTAFLLANPIFVILLAFSVQVVIAVPLMLLLGARRRELGWQKGYRSGRVATILSAPFVIYPVYALLIGKVALPLLLLRTVITFFQAGFSEEVSQRGIIMTRLIRLLGTGWGIGIAALVFGIAHLGTDLFVFKGSLLTAVAMTMFSQMPGGIFYGLVYLRTRSIVAGAIIHTFNDVFAGLLLNS